MPSAQTILETALLLLAAFLLGAVIGHLARRVSIARAATAQRKAAEALIAEVRPEPAPLPLVPPVIAPAIDPIIAPLPATPRPVAPLPVTPPPPAPSPAVPLPVATRRPTAAQRLAAAAGERAEPIVRPKPPATEMPVPVMANADEKSPRADKARSKRATKTEGASRSPVPARTKPETPAPRRPRRPRSSPHLKAPRN